MSDSKEYLNNLVVGDSFTMTWGGELFAPIPFNNYTVGPFSHSTTVQEGETPADAVQRCRDFLAGLAKEEFFRKSKGFAARHKQRNPTGLT